MKKQTVALAVTAGLLLAACGSDEKTTTAASGNATDRAFAAAMIEHHESAVEMAAIAQGRGESKFVKDLAGNIARTQREEIALMRSQDAELAKAGVKPGKLDVDAHMMGMDQDPAMLQTADPFDAAFIKMMVPHHEGAVEMAQEELRKGKDPELLELAQNVVDTQQAEIDQMVKHSNVEGAGTGGHSSDDG